MAWDIPRSRIKEVCRVPVTGVAGASHEKRDPELAGSDGLGAGDAPNLCPNLHTPVRVLWMSAMADDIPAQDQAPIDAQIQQQLQQHQHVQQDVQMQPQQLQGQPQTPQESARKRKCPCRFHNSRA